MEWETQEVQDAHSDMVVCDWREPKLEAVAQVDSELDKPVVLRARLVRLVAPCRLPRKSYLIIDELLKRAAAEVSTTVRNDASRKVLFIRPEDVLSAIAKIATQMIEEHHE